MIRKKEEFTGNYWKHRWEQYLKYIAQYVREINPTRVLEIGTNGLTLCLNSDTLDIEGNPIYLCDITKPTPIFDKQYDLVIATQVWEHLGKGQQEAFKEVMRISHAAILSFPYLWASSDGIHGGIDKKTIDNWTCNEKYDKENIVYKPGRKQGFRRLIRVYKWKE